MQVSNRKKKTVHRLAEAEYHGIGMETLNPSNSREETRLREGTSEHEGQEPAAKRHENMGTGGNEITLGYLLPTSFACDGNGSGSHSFPFLLVVFISAFVDIRPILIADIHGKHVPKEIEERGQLPQRSAFSFVASQKTGLAAVERKKPNKINKTPFPITTDFRSHSFAATKLICRIDTVFLIFAFSNCDRRRSFPNPGRSKVRDATACLSFPWLCTWLFP
jgi:hypothetical protein